MQSECVCVHVCVCVSVGVFGSRHLQQFRAFLASLAQRRDQAGLWRQRRDRAGLWRQWWQRAGLWRCASNVLLEFHQG